MLKPTGYLTFILDKETGSAERAVSLQRAFSYVCPVSIKPGGVNQIILDVKVAGKSLWNTANEDESALWRDIVAPWLVAKLRKIEQTLQEYNNAEAKSFCGAVAFEDAVISLDARAVQFAIIDDQLAFGEKLLGIIRKNDIARGSNVTAPSPETAASFPRRTEETTATLATLAEKDSERRPTGESAAVARNATTRRLSIKERDALRRDPFSLITDFTITDSSGKARIVGISC